MRINPQAASPVQGATVGATAGAAEGRNAQGAGTTTGNVSSHQTSPELQQLFDAVKQTPAVRQDLVAQAKARVAAGAYNTPQAAQQTAAAMVNDPDGDGK